MIRWAGALLTLGVVGLADSAAAQPIDKRAAARNVVVELQREAARLDQHLTEVRRYVAVLVGSSAVAVRAMMPASLSDTFLTTGHR